MSSQQYDLRIQRATDDCLLRAAATNGSAGQQHCPGRERILAKSDVRTGRSTVANQPSTAAAVFAAATDDAAEPGLSAARGSERSEQSDARQFATNVEARERFRRHR